MHRIDKYEVLENVGQGGMGVVHKAFHPHLKKYVAIKEIRAEIASDTESQKRFEREVEILAQLPAHPNLVTVRDALVWNGRLYLVMDFIEGSDLGRMIERGRVDIQRAVKWLGQILSGLEAIHQRGIIHRDLKPGNILIDLEDQAYISDFGIAETASKARMAGTMVSAKYAAPEMIDPVLGRGGAEPQIDIYSAGMLAYEVVLGVDLFRNVFSSIYAGTPEDAAERWLDWHTDLSRPAPKLDEIDRQVPKRLVNIVERMMSKDVGVRYRDARGVRLDLVESGMMVQERMEPNKMQEDDVTVPLDVLRDRKHGNAPTGIPPLPANKKLMRVGARFSQVPKWVIPTAAVAGTLLVILLPLGFYSQPGFTLVVKGAPAKGQVLLDDVLRGIPGIEKDGDKITGVIRVHGLKSGVSHSVRVRCGSGSAKLYLDSGTSVNEMSAPDGGVVNLTARDCVDVPTPEIEIELRGKMRLVIARGPFLMGDDQGAPNERPAHEVNLDYDYYIDKFEVSNKQYREYCNESGQKFPSEPSWAPGYSAKDSYPVVGVSWADASAYCEWAGKRLPKETEWEKAASWDPNATDATTRWKRKWPWGNQLGTDVANFKAKQPEPIGQFANGASGYGVYDMAGNVGEWVEDTYIPYPRNQMPDRHYGGSFRVVRGGTFTTETAEGLRTTRRDPRAPTFSMQDSLEKDFLIGFRCVVKGEDAVRKMKQDPREIK